MPNNIQWSARSAALAGTLLALCGLWSCHDLPTTGTTSGPAAASDAATAADPVLVGAGDVARCYVDGDETTAALLDSIPGTVMAVGDNAYEIDATPERVQSAYRDCYESSWGRHKARTRPVPGNHEYLAPGAEPYFTYFGATAGPAGRGYYSYDLGAWHVIALNSNVAADASSDQMRWLRADLAANQRACTVAYWHHPVFSSGLNGNTPAMAEIWRVLDSAGVDLAIVAHDHDYERFAPQDYTGRADPKGIRQIVVGTGGGDLRPFGASVQANSEVRNAGTYGVLKLTLRSGRYDWEFVPQPGATFKDAGSAACVDEPPVANAGGPYEGSEGTSVTFSAAASSDPEGGVLSYRWNFGDGTSGTGVTVTKTYPNSWTYDVTVTVTDTAGATSTAATTVHVADVPPTATFVAPTTVTPGASFTLALSNATDVSPKDRAAGFTYQFDCGQGWFGAWGTASSVTCPGFSTAGARTVRGRVRDAWDYGHRDYSATVTVGSAPPPPPSGSSAVLLVLDRDAIDNGTAPNMFTAADVNDDIAAVGQRRILRYFASNAGQALTLYSGIVGNEGFFALRSVPSSWAGAGPTADGLQNYVRAGPGLGTPDRTTGWRESLLDRVPDVVPLRAAGLKLLVGRAVCAVVMNNDIWPRTFQPPVANLKGPNLGLVAFQVTDVSQFTGGSASSLPRIAIRVLDATRVCGGELAPLPDAPVLTSWSSPFDVAP